jgi:hypothetical protein
VEFTKDLDANGRALLVQHRSTPGVKLVAHSRATGARGG